ncbi:MAG TPA: hypothetical protein DHV54_02420 [Firmicutes bacterium]|jgi:hypothetical protein|nr:hypothetical protein [Bacillota bacterium]
MKKKVIYSIIIVSVIIILSVAVTYAVYTFSGSVNISGTSECFDVNYVKGQDIGSDSNPANFVLASTYTEGLSSVIKVNLKDTCTITNGTGTLYLNTDTSVTSSTLLSGKLLKYQVLDGTTPVGSGIVSSAESVEIYKDIPITTTVKTITVYIWLDGNLVTEQNQNEILSSVYKGHISMDIKSGDK